MIIASTSQFHVHLPWGQRPFSISVLIVSFLNVKAVVAAFNQEKALVGAVSVIIHHRRLIVNRSSYNTLLTGTSRPAPPWRWRTRGPCCL